MVSAHEIEKLSPFLDSNGIRMWVQRITKQGHPLTTAVDPGGVTSAKTTELYSLDSTSTTKTIGFYSLDAKSTAKKGTL